MKPDRAAVRRLRPGEKIYHRGIEIERRADGDIRFLVAAMIDGRRIHRVVGYASEGCTRRKTEIYLERLRTEAREGRLQLPQGRKLHPTLASVAPQYLARLAGGEGGGKLVATKRYHLEQYLLPFLGRERLSGLARFTLERYRKHRRDEEASDATVNRRWPRSRICSTARWSGSGSLPCLAAFQ
jgi:hypothetical protein